MSTFSTFAYFCFLFKGGKFEKKKQVKLDKKLKINAYDLFEGQMGLFLGISFVSFIEIAQLLIQMFMIILGNSSRPDFLIKL
jgi:hypothetical protein